jgi:histidine ammonia-lyase
MGVAAALKARAAVALLETVAALELLTAAQALEFLRPLRPGRGVAIAHERIRGAVDPLEQDRELGPDIRALESLVRAGAFAAIWPALNPT